MNDQSEVFTSIILHLNPVIGKFGGVAGHQRCRRICLLQAIDNEAGSELVRLRLRRNFPSGRARKKKKTSSSAGIHDSPPGSQVILR
jgi:hypothetical protein